MKFSAIFTKIKQAYTGPRCKFFWFATLATAVFLFVWIVGPGNTIIHWAKAGLETRRQERLMLHYQEQNPAGRSQAPPLGLPCRIPSMGVTDSITGHG